MLSVGSRSLDQNLNLKIPENKHASMINKQKCQANPSAKCTVRSESMWPVFLWGSLHVYSCTAPENLDENESEI